MSGGAAGRGRSGTAGLALRLGLSAMLLGCLAWGERQALGDFLLLGPRSTVDRMADGRDALDGRALDQARAALLEIAAMDPGDPAVREYLGQAAALRAGLVPATDVAAQRTLVDQALAQYRAALALRPNSPYLWAGDMSLIERAALLRRLDAADIADFRTALQRTVAFGPWEVVLLQQVLAVGAAMQPALDPPSRAALTQAAAHLARLGVAP